MTFPTDKSTNTDIATHVYGTEDRAQPMRMEATHYEPDIEYGAWKTKPYKPHPNKSGYGGVLFVLGSLLAILFCLGLAHVLVKVVANLAHFNFQIQGPM